MKYVLLLSLFVASFSAVAQNADTTQTSVAISDTLNQNERTYKVNMAQQRDTQQLKIPHFLQPYDEKRMNTSYQYNKNGQISGGSTKIKLEKRKINTTIKPNIKTIYLYQVPVNVF